ncbi:MAG: TraR/DksA family transcriptional regulator [Flavobacteriales bacterium]|jgi:DnaK suppressor protein|tara:strand:+ start:72 stop:395 length:324 start_codon:yes stop_codon:yes gene_type:complete
MDKTLLKKKMGEELLITQEKIETLKDLTKPIAPDVAIGRISRMDAINNRSVNQAALRQSEFKLQKLKLALIKIEEESFGNCILCGKEIQEGRLMLMPENTFCIRCAI